MGGVWRLSVYFAYYNFYAAHVNRALKHLSGDTLCSRLPGRCH